ncbi:MAG: metal ABC transporter permease [Phycisphaerales bacterium]|nr:metal ABC transporter permease [Phycisphaerales bacterium]
MRTITYLSDPDLRALLWPWLVTGLSVALLAAPLSVLVVLRRLAFIGQGVSHAAVGGVGVVAMLGLAGGSLAATGVIAGACLLAAAAIAVISDRRSTSEDSAIGIVLVGSMALGVLLLQLAHNLGRTGFGSWEAALFGALTSVGPQDAWIAVVSAILLGGTLWVLWRRIVFWAFDEAAAVSRGVPARAMRWALLVLLTLAIVASMRLVGAVLATALLVLPGAIAMELSSRMGRVVAIALLAASFGMVGGIVASIELNLPPGACIVCALALMYGAARGWAWLGRRRASENISAGTPAMGGRG